MDLPLLIAHRGESAEAPENTMAAINLAWNKNCSAVEVDVHLTIDNKLVVIHDTTTKRTGNKNLKIKKNTFRQLKDIDIGSWKGEQWKNEKIPQLTEVLSTLPLNRKLIIEIKCGKEAVPVLKKKLEQSRLNPTQIEIISFNFETICEVKKLLPVYKALWLLDLDYSLITHIFSVFPNRFLRKAKKNNLDGVNVWAGKMLNYSFIIRAKKLNLLVYTWTIDDFEKAKALVNLKVDAITTNRCNWLHNKLNTENG